MSIAPIKPGGWDPSDVLTSDEMNALQTALVDAIDGVHGGTYTLTAPLVFTGNEVRFAGSARIPSGAFFFVNSGGKIDVLSGGLLEISPSATLAVQGTLDLTGNLNVLSSAELNVKSSGRIDVESGAVVNVLNGSTLIVHETASMSVEGTLEVGRAAFAAGASIEILHGGDLNVRDGGDLTLEAGAPGSGAHLNIESGAKIIGSNGAKIQVDTAADLIISGSNVTRRFALRPAWINETTPGTRNWRPDAAQPRWRNSVINANSWIGFALAWPPGDTLNFVIVTMDGKAGGAGVGHGVSLPAVTPLLDIIEMNDNGTFSSIGAVVDDTTALPAYDTPHTVLLSPLYLVTYKPLYLRVRGESGANAVADTTCICSLQGTGIARSYRGANEVV